MKKFKWLLGMLVLALMPMLQSCDGDDGYSIGDFSWDWATVRTTGGGGYYLVGDLSLIHIQMCIRDSQLPAGDRG